jgi:hypothetical protein
MTKKERFMNFVFLAAIARDLAQGTHDSQMIAWQADQIPERNIPLHPLNAAKVFLAYADGRTRPYKWMQG